MRQERAIGSLVDLVDPGESLWIFAYGSMMWHPGFSYSRRAVAHLEGYHRGLSVWSFRYRGTQQQPGLVLGLVPGGTCRGIAFQVEAHDVSDTLGHLAERELDIEGVYLPARLPVALDTEPAHWVLALTFLVNVEHALYPGDLSAKKQASIVARSAGSRGRCFDYLSQTLIKLDERGCADPELEHIARLIADEERR